MPSFPRERTHGLAAFCAGYAAGEPCPPNARVPVADVDHGPFDSLLAKYVDDNGRVGYAEWKANADDCRALHTYLTAAGRADIDSPAQMTGR
jgi:hypothetical protein